MFDQSGTEKTLAGFRIVTKIAAPIELCFNLARDIDFHTRSLFETQQGDTVMIDEVVFQSLPSLPGRLVDALFMTRYLRRLLESRCEAIKREAEASARA